MSSPATPRVQQEPWGQRGAAALAVAAWVALMLFAAAYPGLRLWSVHHLAFLPDGFQWAIIGAGGLSVLAILMHNSRGGSSRQSRSLLNGWQGAVIMISLVVAIGWLAHARTPLLGDGFLRGADAQLEEAPLGSEFLASALAQFMIRMEFFTGESSGYEALGFISLLFAGVLALGLWYYTPRSGISRPWAFVFWILTFGTARLLAGYVESYTPAFAMLVLWGITAIGYMRGRLAPWPMSIFGCLAILSHATALGVVPATLWILWRGRTEGRSHLTPLLVYGGLVAILTAFLAWEINRQQVQGIGVEAGHFLVPLMASADSPYGLLTPAHLIDFLSQWLLLVPGFLVAFAISLVARQAGWTIREATGNSSSDSRVERIFWVLAIVPPLVGSLIIDPKLGWARDWDLMAILATPALIAMAVWLARLSSVSVRRAAGSVAVISVSVWVLLGTNADAEESRFESLLTLDPSRASYGHEILAIYNRVNGKRLGEIRHFKKALEFSDNTRFRANIANAYYDLGRVDEAIRWYQEIYRIDSTFDVARYSLSLALMRQKRYEEAMPHAAWSLANKPNDPTRKFVMGSLHLYLGHPEEALPYLEDAARAKPGQSNYLNMLGGCYLRLNRDREARTAWRQAVKASAKDPSPYVNLALLEYELGNPTEARRLLVEYETLVPRTKWPPGARGLLDTLQRLGL